MELESLRKWTLFAALFLVIVCLWEPALSAQSSAASTRAQCNRNCGTGSSSPVCANNGITYASDCRFNCSLAGNSRLHIVKRGSCAGTSLNEYRGITTPLPRYGSGSSSGSNSWWFGK